MILYFKAQFVLIGHSPAWCVCVGGCGRWCDSHSTLNCKTVPLIFLGDLQNRNGSFFLFFTRFLGDLSALTTETVHFFYFSHVF